MDEEIFERYMRAGDINAEVLSYADFLIKSNRGINIYDLCVKIENRIRDLGGFPAFPCNIGINETAAHLSPLTAMEGSLPHEGVVKIDIGVRVDGCIADAAITVPLSPEFEDMVDATKSALENAIRAMYPGERTGKVGSIIEKTARSRNYKTIRNLSGHLISEYNLHAGKSIPNVKQLVSPKIALNEVYAVEPFLTYPNARGEVGETERYVIYRIERLKKPKEKYLTKIHQRILKKFNRLPFSPRWLADTMPIQKVLEALESMRAQGLVTVFPILVEKSWKPVTQFEHTVLITETGAHILTKKH